jgi:hypothetical protein
VLKANNISKPNNVELRIYHHIHSDSISSTFHTLGVAGVSNPGFAFLSYFSCEHGLDLGAPHVQGRVYRPNVVRVGSDFAPLSQRARDVWVDGLIQQYVEMSEREWTAKYQALHGQITQLSREILTLQSTIADAETQVQL